MLASEATFAPQSSAGHSFSTDDGSSSSGSSSAFLRSRARAERWSTPRRCSRLKSVAVSVPQASHQTTCFFFLPLPPPLLLLPREEEVVDDAGRRVDPLQAR